MTEKDNANDKGGFGYLLLGDERHGNNQLVIISIDVDCRTYELFRDLLDYVVKHGYSVTTERDYKIKAEKHVPLFA